MAYIVSVQLGRLICRNKESSSAPHDIFALAGAVVVDGKRHPFAMPSVPINERQPWTYFETIYDGFSETPQIGLELLGLDIDDNEKWVNNREDAGKLAEKMSDLSEYIPVVGDIASWVIKAIPEVVDQFVEWDKNDELLKLTKNVDMAAEAAVPYHEGSQTVEVKFSGSDPVGYSDWDYSLFVTVTCRFSPAVPFGNHKVEKSLTPFINSRRTDWIGDWEGGSVRCAVRAAKHSESLLDVFVTETGPGETDYETLGVGISKVFLEVPYGYDEAPPFEMDLTGAGAGK